MNDMSGALLSVGDTVQIARGDYRSLRQLGDAVYIITSFTSAGTVQCKLEFDPHGGAPTNLGVQPDELVKL